MDRTWSASDSRSCETTNGTLGLGATSSSWTRGNGAMPLLGRLQAGLRTLPLLWVVALITLALRDIPVGRNSVAKPDGLYGISVSTQLTLAEIPI